MSRYPAVCAERWPVLSLLLSVTATPWLGLEQHGCGRWVSNARETLADAIEWMRNQDLAAMGRCGRGWMQLEYSWELIAGEMHALFEK